MAEAVDKAQIFHEDHSHTVEQSLPKILAYLLRFFLQILMISTSAMSATRTSRLKENWLLRKSKTGFVGYLLQNVPLSTLLLSSTFFFFQFSICLCTSLELLGLANDHHNLEKEIYGYYVQAFLQPLVSLATVSRMARRLDKAARKNADVFADKHGILTAITVHNQEIKVHYTDVERKAELLHGLQIRNIAKRRMLEPDEEFKARPDLTESKIFAVGYIPVARDPTFLVTLLSLFKHLGSMDRNQMRRVIAQSLFFLLSIVAIGIFVNIEGGPVTTAEKSISSISYILFYLSSIFFGAFYEVFAPGLADGVSPHAAVCIFWTICQITILAAPYWLSVVGNPGAGAFHVSANYWLSLSSSAFEVIVSESWISKAHGEASFYRVPSWMEIAIEMESEES